MTGSALGAEQSTVLLELASLAHVFLHVQDAGRWRPVARVEGPVDRR